MNPLEKAKSALRFALSELEKSEVPKKKPFRNQGQIQRKAKYQLMFNQKINSNE